MSRAKALCPNRRLRQSRKIDRLSRAAGISSASFRSKKLGWLEIASSQPGVAIPVKLVPVTIGITMMIAVITMAAVPVVWPVIGSIIRSGVIPVRIRVPVRVISVIARTEPDTEVNLSIRTRGPRDHQTPGHDCNQQKFLHDSPPNNSTGESVESFPVIRSPEQLDTPLARQFDRSARIRYRAAVAHQQSFLLLLPGMRLPVLQLRSAPNRSALYR